jgi:hypothetical protein
LPALVDLPGAAQPTRRPGAVGDSDEEGCVDGGAVRLPELKHEGEQGRVDVPDGGEDEDDDGEAGDAPDEPHLYLQKPKAETLEQVATHSLEAAWGQCRETFYARNLLAGQIIWGKSYKTFYGRNL